MRRELNQYENEVIDYTGLSIARFAHIRNRVKCEDCGHWFKAVKYLTKDIAHECKENDVMDETPQYGIVCGKCGRKYWTKADQNSPLPFATMTPPDYRKMSPRRWKIKYRRLMKSKEWDDD